LKRKDYDGAVAELEKVFLMDPMNSTASKKIDAIKELFIKEKKRAWRKKVVQYNREFSDRLTYSLETVKRLIRERNFMEAKVILNRMAFVDPQNKVIRKLMMAIREEEGKEMTASRHASAQTK
jgi:hypothetical protein